MNNFVNKLDKLGKMETFPERYRLPKMIQEEIQNQNRHVRGKNWVSSQKASQNENPKQDGFTNDFYSVQHQLKSKTASKYHQFQSPNSHYLNYLNQI